MGNVLILLSLVVYSAVHTIHSAVFDNSSNWFSSNKNKTVQIAPFAYLIEMPGYSQSWQDEYMYLFGSLPDRKDAYYKNLVRIEKISTFKVVEDRYRSGSVLGRSGSDICIFENIEDHTQKFADYCSSINSINETTQIYREIKEEIDRTGSAWIGVTEFDKDISFKKIMLVNNFTFFEITKIEEITKLLRPYNPNDRYGISYTDKFIEVSPIVLDKTKLKDEQELYKINHLFTNSMYSYKFLKELISSNKLPNEYERWLIENSTDANERWALRSVVLGFIYLEVQKYFSSFEDSKIDFLNKFNNYKICYAKLFNNFEFGEKKVSEAIDFFLKITKRDEDFKEFKSSIKDTQKLKQSDKFDCSKANPPEYF